MDTFTFYFVFRRGNINESKMNKTFILHATSSFSLVSNSRILLSEFNLDLRGTRSILSHFDHFFLTQNT